MLLPATGCCLQCALIADSQTPSNDQINGTATSYLLPCHSPTVTRTNRRIRVPSCGGQGVRTVKEVRAVGRHGKCARLKWGYGDGEERQGQRKASGRYRFQPPFSYTLPHTRRSDTKQSTNKMLCLPTAQEAVIINFSQSTERPSNWVIPSSLSKWFFSFYFSLSLHSLLFAINYTVKDIKKRFSETSKSH